jgi:hypothetical protein
MLRNVPRAVHSHTVLSEHSGYSVVWLPPAAPFATGRYVRSLVLWHCQTKSRLAWDILVVLLLLQTLITIPYEVNSALAPARTHTRARTGARTHAPAPTHTRARPSAGYCSAHTHPHRRAVRVCIHTHAHTHTHPHGRAVRESADRNGVAEAPLLRIQFVFVDADCPLEDGPSDECPAVYYGLFVWDLVRGPG